ncbi:glycoprotein 3-alpha-L-fucosyltransferase A-like [Venturia canescens]|uniref:glycoprotein 3-alpha-L-fucosyltransferase A-like n=1 Tax=Venturia canescens TaxID=32260 RepID=UPI001C9CB122|nr:glycoprotein 3-alpha-L-fucosyltransferase A-like [Venturia canescens]
MISDCGSNEHRSDYVKELKSLLGKNLDIIGSCFGGNNTACPGYCWKDCPLLSAYKFYLAFENSECREYITEKTYWNAYGKGSVPVILGVPRADCERLLPPRSFIYTADFQSPSKLADYLRYLDNNDDAYDEYHAWRSEYVVLNEHGYFGSRSVHYCRICEALRYNIRPAQPPKYHRLSRFLNAARDCY